MKRACKNVWCARNNKPLIRNWPYLFLDIQTKNQLYTLKGQAKQSSKDQKGILYRRPLFQETNEKMISPSPISWFKLSWEYSVPFFGFTLSNVLLVFIVTFILEAAYESK